MIDGGGLKAGLEENHRLVREGVYEWYSTYLAEQGRKNRKVCGGRVEIVLINNLVRLRREAQDCRN